MPPFIPGIFISQNIINVNRNVVREFTPCTIYYRRNVGGELNVVVGIPTNILVVETTPTSAYYGVDFIIDSGVVR